MSSLSSRARWTVAVVAAFLGGLIIASGGLDLSRLSFAQGRPDAGAVAPLAQASNAFVEIADHVTPAVVSISVESRPTATSQQRRQGQVPPGFEDFFNQLQVQIERKRGTAQLARLEHARLIRAFHGLREDAGRFALGCYLLELLDRLAPEGGRLGDLAALYRFATDALAAIDALSPEPRLRTLLELRLLAAVGLRPELSSCVRCARALSAPRAQFWIADGGPLCERCLRSSVHPRCDRFGEGIPLLFQRSHFSSPDY